MNPKFHLRLFSILVVSITAFASPSPDHNDPASGNQGVPSGTCGDPNLKSRDDSNQKKGDLQPGNPSGSLAPNGNHAGKPVPDHSDHGAPPAKETDVGIQREADHSKQNHHAFYEPSKRNSLQKKANQKTAAHSKVSTLSDSGDSHSSKSKDSTKTSPLTETVTHSTQTYHPQDAKQAMLLSEAIPAPLSPQHPALQTPGTALSKPGFIQCNPAGNRGGTSLPRSLKTTGEINALQIRFRH